MEGMLTHKALTLDVTFNYLANRAHRQNDLKNMEILLRLALKAQAQCRSTVEALALLKNPIPYIQQANLSTGLQQVNNTFASPQAIKAAPTCAGISESTQNKILVPAVKSARQTNRVQR